MPDPVPEIIPAEPANATQQGEVDFGLTILVAYHCDFRQATIGNHQAALLIAHVHETALGHFGAGQLSPGTIGFGEINGAGEDIVMPIIAGRIYLQTGFEAYPKAMIECFVFEVDLYFCLGYIFDQCYQNIEVVGNGGFLATVARFRQRDRQVECQAQNESLVQAGFVRGCRNQGGSDLSVMLGGCKVVLIAPVSHVHDLAQPLKNPTCSEVRQVEAAISTGDLDFQELVGDEIVQILIRLFIGIVRFVRLADPISAVAHRRKIFGENVQGGSGHIEDLHSNQGFRIRM